MPLGGPKQRTVLAMLALARGQVVSADRLVQGVWGADAPARSTATLQVCVSNLRMILEGGGDSSGRLTLLTRRPGYLLQLTPDQLDLARFEALTAEGRHELAAGRPAAASTRLGQALGLWRGQPLADVAFEPFAAPEVHRLEEARLAALEDRIEADLALGRHGELVGELETLIVAHPLRERLWGQLMLAFYRSGRQAEALGVYGRARDMLAEELGLDPGPELQALEQAVLNQQPSLRPPAAAPAGPIKLPIPPTPLVGRRAELVEVAAQLRRPEVRLLTLTGVGGTGKTRLALEASRAVAPEFPDGVFFVGLATISDPSLVVPAIAAAVNVQEVAGQGLLDTLGVELRNRAALLVLDNFEQVLPAALTIGELLRRTERVTVLVTSRAVLHLSGEHEMAVPPLARPNLAQLPAVDALVQVEAVELFLARAQAARADFTLTAANSAAVAEICVRLDGLPLALELAAARIKLLSPEALRERLASRLQLLTGGARDLPAHQRTLRATLDWSHDLLSPDQQALLAYLGAFAGEAGLFDIEQVCGADLDVLDQLTHLVDNSLVRVGHADLEPRYFLLATVREYAAEQLHRRADAERIHRRHAEHYVHVVESARPRFRGPEEQDAFHQLDVAYDNLRAALTWALTHEPTLAARLATGLGDYWIGRPVLREGRTCLDALLQHPGLGLQQRAAVLYQAAALAFFLDDYARASELLDDAIKQYEQLDDALRLVECLDLEGQIAVFSGRSAGLDELAARALHLAEQSGDREALVRAYWLKFTAAEAREDWYQARGWIERVVPLSKQLGHQGMFVTAICNLSMACLQLGEIEQARRLGEESWVAAERSGLQYLVINARLSLGLALLQAGDLISAEHQLVAGLHLAAQRDQRHEVSTGLAGLATVKALSGEPALATRLLAARSQLLTSIGGRGMAVEQLVLGRHQEQLEARLGLLRFQQEWDHGHRLDLQGILRLLQARPAARQPTGGRAGPERGGDVTNIAAATG